MKLCWCCDLEQLPSLEQADIHFAEVNAGMIAALSETQWQAYLHSAKKSKVQIVACNCLISGVVPNLYQSDTLPLVSAYLEKLLPRLQQLGIQRVVFGSGGFRRVPEDVSLADAEKKLTIFLRRFSELFKPYDMVVCIEPLNDEECNILLRTEETVQYLKEMHQSNLQLLIDLYHFDLMAEPLSHIKTYQTYIKHIHLATPVARTCPNAQDKYDYQPFFAALQQIGYDGYVSIECSMQNWQQELKQFQTTFGGYFDEIHPVSICR